MNKEHPSQPDPPNSLDYSSLRTDAPMKAPLGPFVTAVISTMIAGGILIALAVGMQLNLISAFCVLIPGMTFAAMAIAISMGWIFVSIGRYKVRPRWNAGTAVFITITMVELLVLTYIAGTAG
jgi:hypothetical protein